MRVLIIKTSSLGDVIHTLPALTDAAHAIPGIRFDWVVEEGFAEIPSWHPAVDEVIPVAIRRWRKHLWQTIRSGEWKAFKQRVRARKYDLVIDAQGLVKSAWLTRLVKAPVAGLDRYSAREGWASRFYDRRLSVAVGQHAVERVRQLFALALAYDLPEGIGNYGLDLDRLQLPPAAPYVVFLHGTTWATKHWPEAYWRELAERLGRRKLQVRLPWGNQAEKDRAERIAQGLNNCQVLPKLNLAGVARVLAAAKACVAVDTGLGHLAAALDVPTISLFGPTNPGLTGAYGRVQVHQASDFPCAPCLQKKCTYKPSADDLRRFDLKREWPLCFTRLNPEHVASRLSALLLAEDVR
ncbi:lipopolysaccharide heptosyltransferase I [Pseudomonas putida]|uniref:lipopolysaccharide heptosyltransferase I n=1 Tax=Pseudomonas TaxID=286 RepID=UPI0006D3F7DC|nr:lipopolysaccharide heptosyltransferase I [Pseudomonas sp. NBRC 111131]MBI6942207.1 lipopolysaccharide heptosyltransferase I [Pseudomonas putida]MBI6960741.1 lipopolysaccharide heptosyltransferase I [Pseudomonas putida]PZQ41110.1 MAG: lipopolysaccharide heptosyltransferase I [Pseudomonas putida]